MKQFILALAVLCCPLIGFCQDITGLWTGTMYNDSTKQSLPYEIFITKDNGKYTGFSQTWFVVNDKKCFGIKKIKVHVAKDGKVVMQDEALIEHTYPIAPDKNVNQLNVLDLVAIAGETTMDGPFATRRTKEFTSLTGRITIKKVTASNESSLMQYLQKSGIDNGIAAAK
jgi:hypothetical protein